VILLWIAVSAVEIDRYVRTEMELNHLPGLALAVVREGAVETRAFGVKSLATGEAMTVDTPVELASVSKSFTALAVMRLGVELDRPVVRYLPEFSLDARIRVRHLLQHTSGLARADDFLVPCCGRPGEFNLGLAVRRIGGARLRRAPGEAFRYANSNYVLLAAVVERVSGQPFPAYMRSQVFEPLGMTRTTVEEVKARATPHEWQWGRMQVSPSRFSGWYGASMVKSTARDMGRYLAALPASGWWTKPKPPVYDMGWFLQPKAEWLKGTPVLEHTGDIWGGNTAVVVAPELRLGVAVLINGGTNRAGPIARGVLRQLAGLPAPVPRTMRRVDNPDFWAMCFAAAAGVILVGVVAYGMRVRRQFVRGEHCFVRSGWAVARAVVLAAMAGCLVFLLGSDVTPPLAAYPATVKMTLPALVVATALLLLGGAISGLAGTQRTVRD